MIIGITGGIGSGKSVVARILRLNGFIVYDCDSEAKRIMVNNEKIKSDLISLAGLETFFPDGSLNTNWLSSKIFSNPILRMRINEKVHSAVRNDIENRIKKKNQSFFIESAILATGGLLRYCDKVWIVESPLKLRFERIAKRDCLSLKQINSRMAAQQQELDRIGENKIVIIENKETSPLLREVLKNIGKLNNIESLCLKKF